MPGLHRSVREQVIYYNRTLKDWNDLLHLYLLLLENVLTVIFCFLKEKIIYPLKDIRLLCIVFPHLASLIPPSEHLSACNQHTMTLTNNN